eukprot:CAMPEP_0172505430 /NCGR_PEP_ID=MMETSP1066-20121228/186432_1 /TAXON_ID=671091 /ORGANISM="Coscinodiscus wailesii, Strain CCMP2513" /LENGTH=257 /DNA_ID=CAMNT_0013282033 /DNA_START=55 /DNA_END=825 /DNA_ORIENTATION=+
MTKTCLVLVDPQNDFHPGGSLAIPTASDDAKRISDFIRANKNRIDDITVTLDSHHRLHIAHGKFWIDEQGNHPAPFTMISSEDIEKGKWVPRTNMKIADEDEVGTGPMLDPKVFPRAKELYDEKGELDLKKYCEMYIKMLEEGNRFKFIIWPEHCRIGTEGHNVVRDIDEAIIEWIDTTGSSVTWILKGHNNLTEMYSAFQAEIPLSKMTSFNQSWFNRLRQFDRILFAGQALSHCVNFTVRDLVSKWPKNEMNKIW